MSPIDTCIVDKYRHKRLGWSFTNGEGSSLELHYRQGPSVSSINVVYLADSHLHSDFFSSQTDLNECSLAELNARFGRPFEARLIAGPGFTVSFLPERTVRCYLKTIGGGQVRHETCTFRLCPGPLASDLPEGYKTHHVRNYEARKVEGGTSAFPVKIPPATFRASWEYFRDCWNQYLDFLTGGQWGRYSYLNTHFPAGHGRSGYGHYFPEAVQLLALLREQCGVPNPGVCTTCELTRRVK